MRRLFMVLLVAAATGCGDMPYEVTLSSAIMASTAGVYVHRCEELTLAPLSIQAGRYPASDILLSPSRTMVLAEIPGGERWVEAPSPMSNEDNTFLLGLEGRGGDCPFVMVEPFDDGRRVIATTNEGIMAVELPSRRVRMLDHRASTLENCRMTRARSVLECHLDLNFEAARFDRDGNELNGTFTPAWAQNRR